MDTPVNGPNGNPATTTPPARRGRPAKTPDSPAFDPEATLQELRELGTIPALNPEASEAQVAEILGEVLRPIRCHDDEWYQYTDGCWVPVRASRLGDATLKLLAPEKRTERRATAIIKHLGMILNAETVPEYRTFILQEPDRTLLNCTNGVLAVSRDKVELLAHSSNYNFVKRLAVSYDPKATCPVFEKTLAQTMPDAVDSILFQMFAGYGLLDHCNFQACLLLMGPGSTGKSTILNAISSVYGPELIASVGLSTLCDMGSFALPTLKGKAINIATELDTKEIKESSIFKALVCGEPVPNRAMYKGYQEMATHCKLIFATNTPPWFARCTDAELRRLRMISCYQKVKKADPRLTARIAKETAGIFNFILEGMQLLIDRDEMPHGGASSRAMMERYTKNATSIQTYAKERLDFAPSLFIGKKDLHDDYCQWSIQVGGITWKRTSFQNEIERLFPDIDPEGRHRISGVMTRCYDGMGLRPEE